MSPKDPNPVFTSYYSSLFCAELSILSIVHSTLLHGAQPILTMSLLQKIFGTRKSEIFTNDELVDADLCPNCWGRHAYDGEYVDYVKDQTKSNTNHDTSNQKAFIQQFVETNVSGIKLRNNDGISSCPACKIEFTR